MKPKEQPPTATREWLSDELVSSAVIDIEKQSGLVLSKDQVRGLAERLGNLFNVVGFDCFESEGHQSDTNE